MSVTGTGIFIIVLGIFFFFYSNKWLFASIVFFIPFTATAVINFGSQDSGSSIQPYMFLSVLFIMKNFAGFLKSFNGGKIYVNRYRKYFFISYLIFIAVVAISLIMPIMIAGTTKGNITGDDGEFLPIEFTNRNITQFLYFFLGITFSIFVNFYITDKGKFFFMIKAFSYSVLFVMVWGMFEFALKKLSLPYPAQIFNNSVNAANGGYAGLLDNGVSRVSSVGSEPSIIAQNIVVFVPFILVGIENGVYIFSKIRDSIFVGSIFVFIVLTTSSSGITSALIVIFMYFITKRQELKRKILTILRTIVATLLLLPVIYILFRDIVESSIINKGTSYSAMERIATLKSGWSNFLEYPILGVGWGAITVNDFFLRILATTGLLGFIFMTFAIFYIYKSNLSILKSAISDFETTYLNRACLLSFFILLFNCEIGGFSFYYGIFWLIFGFCMIDKKNLAATAVPVVQ